mmetsp:Transcript_140284/g.364603  ORF Transcript_140284/g.364603 Transcript_140284/m.364603 type:complete len:526 (-) Transcript_140284:95-1672(-)
MGGAFSQCGSASKTSDPAANPQVEVEITEIKACLESIKQKDEILEDLRAQLREKKGEGAVGSSGSPKPRATPDFQKTSLKQLKDMAARFEQELEQLKTEEDALRQQIFKSSVYFQKAHSKTSALLALSSAASRASSSATIGVMTPEEQEFIADSMCLLNEGFDWCLVWDRRWQGQPMGPIDEHLRRNRREGTKKKVVQELGLRNFGESAWRAKRPQQGGIHLFLDRTPASTIGSAPAGGTFLLGRYDVVAVKVCADLDRNWNFIKGPKNDFWVAHAAALNIGESMRATDFHDFSRQENEMGQNAMGQRGQGMLEEELYLEAMEHIMANVCQACTRLHVEHLIFFPFGMGAFLRHLRLLDGKFAQRRVMQDLRRKLTHVLMKALVEGLPDSANIHLCISFGNDEAKDNGDAFLRAVVGPGAAMEELRKRLTVWPSADALQVAHVLAQASPEKVVLVNGANRRLIGNHWFEGKAKWAIDENLHRRSWTMSAIAYVLNGYDGQDRARSPQELQNNVLRLGGQVHVIGS